MKTIYVVHKVHNGYTLGDYVASSVLAARTSVDDACKIAARSCAACSEVVIDDPSQNHLIAEYDEKYETIRKEFARDR